MSVVQVSRVAFFTVTDRGYFPGTVALVNSLRAVGHDESIVVLDTGMTPHQRELLAGQCVILPLDGARRAAANPTYYKLVAPPQTSAEVVVLIDGDIIVTSHLGALLGSADDGQVVTFPDPEGDRWFAEWDEIFSLGCEPRRQVYVNAGLVAFSRVRLPALLSQWTAACERIRSEPTIAEGASGPVAQADQDALNAVLMAHYRSNTLHVAPAAKAPQATALRWGVRVRDESSLECWYGSDRCLLLHSAGNPKPWRSWTGIRRTAYVRLMVRLLDGGTPGLAVRLPRAVVPRPVRAGACLSTIRAVLGGTRYVADRRSAVRVRVSRALHSAPWANATRTQRKVGDG